MRLRFILLIAIAAAGSAASADSAASRARITLEDLASIEPLGMQVLSPRGTSSCSAATDSSCSCRPRRANEIHAAAANSKRPELRVAANHITENQQPTRQPVTLPDLTAPADLLTAECGLAPTSFMRRDNHTVSGWEGLPISTNPWTGTDPNVIASIYERMYTPPPMPDGPPLDRSAQLRYRLRLAEGVDEGYAAFYQQSEPARLAVRVYALKFGDTGRIADPARGARPANDDRLITWIRFGRIAALMVGERDACAQILERHLKSLAMRP